MKRGRRKSQPQLEKSVLDGKKTPFTVITGVEVGCVAADAIR